MRIIKWGRLLAHGKHFPLLDRLRLFQATVTPCVLYGAAAWTMTQSRERRLRGAQRKMLRKILGLGRRKLPADDEMESATSRSDSGSSSVPSSKSEDLEPWTEWVVRVTRRAELQAAMAGVADWVTEQRKRKWQWAGHIVRREDARWGHRMLDYVPSGRRSAGLPVTRWDVSLERFVTENLDSDRAVRSWAMLAAARSIWSGMQSDFVKATA